MKITLTASQRAGVLAILVATVLLSAIAVAYSGYMNRQSFIALKRSLAEYSELQITFGKLQLEKSSWASPAVVQVAAEEKLHMQSPAVEQTVVIVSPSGLSAIPKDLATRQAALGVNQ